MSAAQFEFEPQEAPFAEHGSSFSDPDTPAVKHLEASPTASALKLQAAERLAAHRARRGQVTTPESHAPKLPGLELALPLPQAGTSPQPGATRASRIAAAVAERYAHSQTYRAFLAAEAERAIHHAEAAAQVAARTAEAVVATQQQLLTELENWEPEPPVESAPRWTESLSPQPSRHPAVETTHAPAPGLTVRLYEDTGQARSSDIRREVIRGTANAVPQELVDEDNEDERLALDDEIVFRKSPVFAEPPEPATPIPANLIEFPRQLVASRKARPRLAEGPLREEADNSQQSAQLRIFEVQADQISTLPSTESTLPEWSSIRLSAHAAAELAPEPETFVSYATPLLPASLSLRLMSALVDSCILMASFLAFATVVAYTAGRFPTGQVAVLSSVGILAVLFLIYQLLFFTFSNATPGMRYARIGFCTFSDENPTRSAMRRRLIAILLAACPVGLGFLWAYLDDDRLGWHDRISRMYQRSY